MSNFTFTKAVKQQEKLRLALDGPSGSGKTWTSLTIGEYLADKERGRIAVIDSERSSAKKYASYFDFDHLTLPDSNPHTYIGAIEAAVSAGYAVIIIDSLSHAWEGVLELKDEVAKRSRSKDSFGAWREVTPVHNNLVDTMLRVPAHVIATMRTKTEYIVEKDDQGKTSVSKVGMKPIQRDGAEYEFDIVGDMDQENTLVVSKTRCHDLSGGVIHKPGVKLAEILWNWLTDGEPAPDPEVLADIKTRLNALGKVARREFLDEHGHPDKLTAAAVDEALVTVTRIENEQQTEGDAEFDVEPAPERQALMPSSATPYEEDLVDPEPDPADVESDEDDGGGEVDERLPMKRLFALLDDNGITDDLRHKWASNQLDREITSFSQLTDDDIAELTVILRDGPRREVG